MQDFSEIKDEDFPSEPVGDYRQEILRLKSLVNAFNQLDSSLNLEQVLRSTLTTATTLMSAHVGSIALLNEEGTHLNFVESTDENFDKLKDLSVPLGEGIAGNVAATGKSARLEDVHADRRFYGEIDEKLGQRTQSYLCVPLMVQNKVIGTAQIMNRLDGQSFTADDEKLLEGFACQAAMAINNARMHRIMLEQKAIESELEVCTQIQQKLFPEAPPKIPGYELFGSSVSCRAVGGDYYSFLRRGDLSYDVVIADVSGKGLAAALMVSEVHTGLHLLTQLNHPLDRTIQVLHDHLAESLILGKFVTMFAMRIYPDNAQIEYVLAGHPSPFIVNGNGKMERLERTGTVLGLAGTPKLSMGTFAMEPGDVLVAFSDGYSEAQDPRGNLFDEERIGELTLEFNSCQLSEIRKQLDESVNRFTNDAPAPDDATLLLVRKINA